MEEEEEEEEEGLEEERWEAGALEPEVLLVTAVTNSMDTRLLAFVEECLLHGESDEIRVRAHVA